MMGGRFIALIAISSSLERIRNTNPGEQLSRIPDFHVILDRQGVLAIGDCRSLPIEYGNEGGAAIGSVFELGGLSRINALPERAASRIIATEGAAFKDEYWGRFVSILACDKAIHVQRDPSGMMPCYYFEYQGVLIITSDLESCFALGLLKPEIDWAFVHGHLVADQFCTERTGLTGVLELLPGCRLTVSPAGTDLAQMWSPWQFATRSEQIIDLELATDRLRAAILDCLAATVSEFSNPLLGVSGGLDSSIIAAAVKRTGSEFSCLTMVTDEPIGDERPYARKLAQYLDVPLVEEFRHSEGVDPRRSHASHLPRPVARCFAQESDRIHIEVASRLGADVFIGGGGGDSLFCFLQSPAVIADRLLVEGWGSGAWRTLIDICDAAHCSLPRAGGRAIRRAYFRDAAFRWPMDWTFVRPRATDIEDRIRSDVWLDVPRDGLPGKAAHIAYLKGMQVHMEGYARERILPNLWPLVSQPVVELCLRIPTWMWCSGGQNRAVARQAFSDLLPPEIAGRRTKGAPSGFIVRLFETYKKTINAMLLDGCLGKAGVVDLPAIERAFSGKLRCDPSVIARLFTLLDVEAWARSWIARR